MPFPYNTLVGDDLGIVRIELRLQLAWEFKAIYPAFQMLVWEKEIGYWYSGEEDYGL